eukprot:CAMPEP_0206235178 /NCGR_PEP_ID=MMETSP0047_2-20121206/13007_1 /ASSEMBLY_ACC=CAM_ASM_000192 /TAXON_ID=195065 /ORGANISM="Chroomonas mesostigmatica_cf, Strain CCMP1168" /LENGTH=79 /DNA_ID=CAMNT_0053659357 /DNA_START=421 /DNA_END=656 /DNA_ORIENTATION=+
MAHMPAKQQSLLRMRYALPRVPGQKRPDRPHPTGGRQPWADRRHRGPLARHPRSSRTRVREPSHGLGQQTRCASGGPGT